LEARLKTFFKDEVKEMVTEIVHIKATREFKNSKGNLYEEWSRLPHLILRLLN
jgi:hypothetical protein